MTPIAKLFSCKYTKCLRLKLSRGGQLSVRVLFIHLPTLLFCQLINKCPEHINSLCVNDSLVSPSELWLGSAQQVCDEIGLAADVDVALVWAAAQALVECSGVAFLLTAVQLTHKDVVGPQHLVFTVCAEPDNHRESKANIKARHTCRQGSDPVKELIHVIYVSNVLTTSLVKN